MDQSQREGRLGYRTERTGGSDGHGNDGTWGMGTCLVGGRSQDGQVQGPATGHSFVPITGRFQQNGLKVPQKPEWPPGLGKRVTVRPARAAVAAVRGA